MKSPAPIAAVAVAAGVVMLATATSSAPQRVASPGDEVRSAVATLRDRHRLESEGGLTALRELALAVLRRGLADPDPFERCYAASALAGHGDWSGGEILEQAIAQARPDLRRAAIDGLAEVGGERALRLLETLWQESDDLVPLMVLQALRGTRDRGAYSLLAEALERSDPSLRMQAIENLGLLGDPRAAGVLRRALARTDARPFERTAAAHALLRLGDRSGLSYLVDAIADPEPNVRAAALLALADGGDEALVPRLREALDDPSPDVVLAASAALTHYGSREGLPVLGAAVGDPDPITRRHLGLLFERIDRRLAPELVERAIGSDDAGLRMAAIHATGAFAGEESIGRLARVLETESDPLVRADVAWALGRIASPASVDPLVGLIQEDDAAVRHTAADGLARTSRRLLRAGGRSAERPRRENRREP